GEQMMAAAWSAVYALAHLLIAWACVALAIRRLRRAALGPSPRELLPAGPAYGPWGVPTRVRRSAGAEEGEAARVLSGPDWVPLARPPPVGDRPLLWKEMYQGGPSIVGPSPRRLLKRLAGPWLVALFLAGLWALVVRATYGDHDARGLNNALNVLC